jgi:hypothetical protein
MKLLILLLITVGFLVAGCSSKDHTHDDGIAYWTCPMHPEIKEDSQVGCPICGMDLTPVRQDNDDNHRHMTVRSIVKQISNTGRVRCIRKYETMNRARVRFAAWI